MNGKGLKNLFLLLNTTFEKGITPVTFLYTFIEETDNSIFFMGFYYLYLWFYVLFTVIKLYLISRFLLMLKFLMTFPTFVRDRYKDVMARPNSTPSPS